LPSPSLLFGTNDDDGDGEDDDEDIRFRTARLAPVARLDRSRSDYACDGTLDRRK
jgi:hypothetical protein